MADLLTARETATELRLSIHTVRAWVHQRRLPVVRLGRKVLFKKADLERLVNENVVEARRIK